MVSWSGLCSVALVFVAPVACGNVSLPIVDLGYTLHQGTIETASSGVSYLNFSNIRYAAPPVGKHRFAAPVWPEVDRTVQNGEQEFICSQSSPGWITTANQFMNGKPLTDYHNFTTANITRVDPRTSEDCLFLDVLASKAVYENKNNGSGAAVLVWIHGGGYAAGWKTLFGTGRGLITRSEGNRDGGIVYVSINYRLGLFGWLATGSKDSGPVSNAGLLDQRFALEWIQKHIHLFGGDPKRVTVMGESAGGGSVLHQATAYGHGKVPFSKAIVQSPYVQYLSPAVQKNVYRQVLETAKVNDFKALKNMSSSALQTVNALVVGNALPYGTFAFGPVVDGSFVPDEAPNLLATGRFNRSVKVMTGHNSNEGSFFTDSTISNDSAYQQLLRDQIPDISESAFNKITKVLYPPISSGESIYTTEYGRAIRFMAEFMVDCNSHSLNSAYGAASFAYHFSVPPGGHGEDVKYTFYDGVDGAGLNTTLATLMQRYFLNFAVSGSPNAESLPLFPSYSRGIVQNLNNTLLGPIQDGAAVARCSGLQKALYR